MYTVGLETASKVNREKDIQAEKMKVNNEKIRNRKTNHNSIFITNDQDIKTQPQPNHYLGAVAKDES